ncbi:phycobilisome protein [Microcoleus sp. FACHB-1515]|uniref:phycobilisome protein n=1 Tax=Cyanophyceae TaxID=3028117 RepID=UPI00168A3875|nr:phycobilisome protein [Microcoleus sp. FACHB-1515]MBD2089557.1 phycobilisome protein [Microcoleus sp. FACHB-1515]
MLSQLQHLSQEIDGRYATDTELQFLTEIAQTFHLRAQTYQKLQAAEATIIQQLQTKMQALDPTLFRSGSEDITAKWKRDTIRVLRYSAIAMLLNDPDTLRDRLLFWMQTVMKAFGAQRSCNVTYELMQDIVKQHLTPPQAKLFCPILELNRRSLGIS